MWTKLFGIGALDGAAFTRYVAKLGVKTGRFVNPDVDAESMRIKTGDELMNLSNRHHMFLQLPRRKRLQFIHDTVLVQLPTAPDTWADAKGSVIPVVRDGGYLAIAPLHARGQAQGADRSETEIARRPLATGVFETLVVDLPAQMIVVTRARLADWGVSFDEAIEAAYTNLRKQSQDPFRPLAPGLWTAPWTDSYAAARTTLPEILQRVCSDPLVALPNRDTLLVGDSSQSHVFELMVAAIAHVKDARYPISPRIFQLEGKTLRDYPPPASLPTDVRHAYAESILEYQVGLYNEEKSLREQSDDESFYAKLLAYQLENGDFITRATWTKGVPTHLPPADAVIFVDLDDGKTEPNAIYEVPWSVVAAEPGMLTETGSALPRWRTGTFPSADWLERHKTRSKD